MESSHQETKNPGIPTRIQPKQLIGFNKEEAVAATSE